MRDSGWRGFSAKMQKFTEFAESRNLGNVLSVRRLRRNREGDFLQKRVFCIYKSKDCAKLPVFLTFS